jgi:MFS family permease
VETLQWKKPWAIRTGFFQRSVILLIALAVLLLGGRYPDAALAVFFILYTGMQVLAGIATPGWFDFYAKVTPLRKRGRLSGLRTSLGSLAALLGGVVLTILLSAFDFPTSFAIGFFLAFLLQMTSLGIQRQIVEAEPSQGLQRRSLVEYLRQQPEVFRANKDFRTFIFSAAVLAVANMPIGFFTVYALTRFNVDESAVGTFTLSMLSTQVISALAGGYISDHYGNKRSLIIAATGMLLASLSALLAPSPGWFLLVFFFVGLNIGTELMGRYNISVEYGPVEQRSTYIALMNTALAPVYLSGLLGGWISDLFGYPVLFGVSALFSIAGLYILLWRVRDPRHLLVEPAPVEQGVA